jgi:prepilin-type N-terminal cleavage/methylation domain-containing protein
MRRQRGFTLIEMALVIGLVAIVAALAVTAGRAARRNAAVGGASFELVSALGGLKAKALSEQRDHLAVLLAGDGGDCGLLRPEGCVRLFVLAAPTTDWALEDFDPESPGENLDADAGELVDRVALPNGLSLHGAAAGMAGKPPFANVEAWDGDLDATCGSVRCVAFRFRASGEVWGETPDGIFLRKPGHIVALATDLEGQTHAAERRAVLVSFPSGIVKSYAY